MGLVMGNRGIKLATDGLGAVVGTRAPVASRAEPNRSAGDISCAIRTPTDAISVMFTRALLRNVRAATEDMSAANRFCVKTAVRNAPSAAPRTACIGLKRPDNRSPVYLNGE